MVAGWLCTWVSIPGSWAHTPRVYPSLLYFRGLYGEGEVFILWKPQGNERLDCQAAAGVGWKDALIFVPKAVLPPRLEAAGWAGLLGGDNGVGGLLCSGVYGFPLAQEVLPHQTSHLGCGW